MNAMKYPAFAAAFLFAMLAASPRAEAVVCADGVYRAGCAGPNGAAAVRKPPVAAAPKCAAGVYRAGCVGPNGAVVHRRY
jgi:hypothetical protein